MPLAAHLVRIEVQIAVLRLGQTRQGERHERKFRVQRQKTPEHALVLRVVERAGGIDHRAAGAEHLRGLRQNLHLAVGTAARGVGVPFVARFRLAAEHALAGAGRVHQNAVEKRGEARRERIRHGAEHDGVANAHALDVAGENLRAAGDGLVAAEQPAPRHQRGDLRALAAGRGAEVEHPLAGLGIERGDGGQGARLLHVKQAALVQRRQAGARVALDEIRALRPRDGRAEPLDGAGRRSIRAEEQVDAQRAGIRLIQRVKIRKKACFTEQALHLFFKFFRQWLHIT